LRPGAAQAAAGQDRMGDDADLRPDQVACDQQGPFGDRQPDAGRRALMGPPVRALALDAAAGRRGRMVPGRRRARRPPQRGAEAAPADAGTRRPARQATLARPRRDAHLPGEAGGSSP
jgi:hypothetical protein